jgi:hypothetical protein
MYWKVSPNILIIKAKLDTLPEPEMEKISDLYSGI